VDGKTVRGSRHRDGTVTHLLAAALHGSQTVLTQRQVDAKGTRSPHSRRCSEAWTWKAGSSPPTRYADVGITHPQ
jgi:hypothetical protein